MLRKALLPFAVLLLLLTGAQAAPEQPEPLDLTLLRVGKADAIVARCGGDCLVIDTGEEDDGADLVRFLRRQGAERVDVLIITHFDKDHVGGAARLLEQLEVGRILTPDYESENPACAAFFEALERCHLAPERLRESVSLSLGSAGLLVEPSAGCVPAGDGGQDNNLSLITTLTHGDLRLVFAGDAEKQRIREWLAGDSAQPCDFLKVPHHGVYGAGLRELFSQLDPAYAVICSSEKNPADEKTLALLEKQGAQVFQTRDGDVWVASDGRSLCVRQETGQ